MPDNMSFLPEDYLDKRVARRTNVICISLFAVVMVGVVAAFFVTGRQRSEVRAQQAEVNKLFEEAARRLEQLEELQAQKQQMVHKAKIASILVERVPRPLLIAEIVNHMPANLSLLEFGLKTDVRRAAPPRTAMEREKKNLKARAKAAEPRIEAPQTVVTIRMIGVAPPDVEVAQFITEMSNHPIFRDAILQYSEQTTVENREMRRFGVELKVNQDIDLRSIEPTFVKRDLKMDPMGQTIQITGETTTVAPRAPQATPVVDRP